MLDYKFKLILKAASEGRLDLPDDVLALGRAYRRLPEVLAQITSAPEAGVTGTESAAQALLTLLGTDAPLPMDFAAQAHGASLIDDQQRAARTVYEMARQMAETELESAVVASVPTAIESLRPRLADILDDVRAAVAVIGDAELSDRAMLAAAPDARAAWLSISESLAPRYNRLRSTWRELLTVGGAPVEDTVRLYGEVKDAWIVWPELNPQRMSEAPWPAEADRRLLWAVTGGHTLWLPTRRELEHAADAARQARQEAAREAALARQAAV